MSGEDAFLLTTASVFAASLTLSVAVFRRLAVPDRRAGGWALALGNAVVFAATASLALVALESYYRFGYDTTDGNNRSMLSRRWFERHWAVNRLGVRDDVEYAMARQQGRRRITFFGDSFTAAQGVPDVEDRFVNRVRRSRPQWEVHAFAYNGLNTPEELAQLRRRLSQGYELDVVVLVYSFNDVVSFLPEFQRLFRRVDFPPRYLAFLIDNSYALNLFYHRFRRRQLVMGSDGIDYDALKANAYRGKAWEYERGLLGLFEKEVTSHSGTLAVVTFPWLYKLVQGSYDRQPHDAIDAYWRERGIPHLDLLPVLEAHRGNGLLVNRHDAHPSVFAHALAAEAIVPFLDEVVAGAR